jgi:uncharacterized protein YyaL (SSP411 family)
MQPVRHTPASDSQAEGRPAKLPESVRQKLFAQRQSRARPFKDDKVLVSWNGLMIASLARAGGVFQERRYLEAAEKAAAFLFSRLRSPEGGLLHRYRGGEAAITAYATDYAYLIWGLIELYEATFDPAHLRGAYELMQEFIDDYWDEGGGFFLTADDAEQLLVRQRNDTDGALPSAGSVALLDLLKLEALIRSTSRLVRSGLPAFTFFLSALDFQIGPALEVVIAGDAEADDAGRMAGVLRRQFAPNKVVLFRPAGEERPEISDLAPFTRFQRSIDGRATAYVCRDYACELPVTDSEEMLRLLRRPPQSKTR